MYKNLLNDSIVLNGFCLGALGFYISILITKLHFFIISFYSLEFTPSNPEGIEVSASLFISTVPLTAILETTLLFFLPYKLLERLGFSGLTKSALVITPFALLHLSNDVFNAISAIFFGYIFYFAFDFWRKKRGSYKTGFIACAWTHATYNFFWFLLYFVPASWIV